MDWSLQSLDLNIIKDCGIILTESRKKDGQEKKKSFEYPPKILGKCPWRLLIEGITRKLETVQPMLKNKAV